MAPANFRTNLSVRRTVKCMRNPRRVKMVAKQIMRELFDMLLIYTVLQVATRHVAQSCTWSRPLPLFSHHHQRCRGFQYLQVVKVYVSVFGDDKGKYVAIAGLKSKAKYVRSELGKRMKLRSTPEVRFIKDESMERRSSVIATLDKIKVEKGSEEGKNHLIPRRMIKIGKWMTPTKTSSM